MTTPHHADPRAALAAELVACDAEIASYQAQLADLDRAETDPAFDEVRFGCAGDFAELERRRHEVRARIFGLRHRRLQRERRLAEPGPVVP